MAFIDGIIAVLIITLPFIPRPSKPLNRTKLDLAPHHPAQQRIE
jgi:hypothetical protein